MSEVSNRRFVHFDGTREEFEAGGYGEYYPESIVFINANGDEYSSIIYTHGEYYGNGGVISKGDVDNSGILIGEYDGYKNRALSKVSLAIGAASTAGLKGWYYKHVNISKKQIFLGSSRTKILGADALTCTSILYSDSKYTDTSFVSGYEVGDVISLVYNAKYEDYATITAISGNVLTLDKIPFVSGDFVAGVCKAVLATDPDEFSVYCIKYSYNETTKQLTVSKHDVGGVDFGGGALAEGVNNYALNIGAHAEGIQTIAKGQYSHTEGFGTVANYSAHAEGKNTKALGEHSHAEGFGSKAIGNNSHAEGYKNLASGPKSHAEGDTTVASGNNSHSEGVHTLASGPTSHVEGYKSEASADCSHTEGAYTYASGASSHAEGKGETLEDGTINKNLGSHGIASHSEGLCTLASGKASHSEGANTISVGDYSHSEGYKTSSIALYSHAEGEYTTASGRSSHAEGYGNSTKNTEAKGLGSHAEGHQTIAEGNFSHAEGSGTEANGLISHAEGYYTTASGSYSHSEGFQTNANGDYSHAEGYYTTASGSYSHSEGFQTNANGDDSHAEGNGTEASGNYSHSEGKNTGAIGGHSHAEGYGIRLGNLIPTDTTDKTSIETDWDNAYTSNDKTSSTGRFLAAVGECSHAEGHTTLAYGNNSHAEGEASKAKGNVSHAEGLRTRAIGIASHAEGESTVANNRGEHACGRFNKSYDDTLFSVGYGTGEGDRMNAIEITKDGSIYIGGTSYYRGYDLSNISGSLYGLTQSTLHIYHYEPNANSLRPSELYEICGQYKMIVDADTDDGTEGTICIEQKGRGIKECVLFSPGYDTTSDRLYIKIGRDLYLSNDNPDEYIYAPYANLDLYCKNVYDSSDISQKNIISNIDIDFNKLKQIPKVNFTWKNDKEEKNNIGTIAQELEKIYPEFVHGEDGNKGVNYAALSIVALAAIDILAERINEIEKIIQNK